MGYTVPLDERETIISFGRQEPGCEIYTSDDKIMTKLDKLCKSSDHYSLKKEGVISGTVVDKVYTLDDKSLIAFRGKKKSETMTDEQKEAASERLKEWHKSQNRK